MTWCFPILDKLLPCRSWTIQKTIWYKTVSFNFSKIFLWGSTNMWKFRLTNYCARNSVFRALYDDKHQLHFRTELTIKASRAHGFVPSRGWPQGIDLVRSKLSPLHVPVNPSPVSREANRYLWRSICPSTIGVFKLRTSLWTRPPCLQILWTVK